MVETITWHQHNIDIFPGFYNSVLDGDDAIEALSDIEETELTFKPGVFKDYMVDVASLYVKKLESEAIEGNLDHVIRDLELEEIRSPQFYNYTTDKLTIRLKINKWNALRELVKDKENFNKYLKERYTSCSGFFSFAKNEFYALWRQKEYFWDIALDYLIQKQDFFEDQGGGSESYWALSEIVDEVIPDYLEPVEQK